MRHTMLLSLFCTILALSGTSCWSQGGVTGLPPGLIGEMTNPEGLPEGTYTLVREWQAEAAGHNTGRLVDDPQAEGGKAWECKPEVDQPETMLYGPYMETEAGVYVAFFRVKLLEAPEDESLGTLDACVAYAQDILVSQDLVCSELKLDQYVQVPLAFRYDKGKLECRFTWAGYMGLRIDGVKLYRYTGSDLAKLPWRVAEAVPSGLPKNLPYYSEPRPFPDVFPRSSQPAKELLVCDLRKQRLDMRLAMFALQGLVNRTQPRVWTLSVPTDELWLKNLQDQGLITGTKTATPQELLEKFKDVVKGCIITDPALPASKNVATMLAAVRDALPVSQKLAQKLGLPVLEDLRGRWQTSAEAYRWAFDNLWPQLNHHVIACSWPDHLGLRDYLVQNKVFIFWISGALDGARKYASPDAEVRLMEELLAKMPVNIPVMSYPWAGKDIGIGEGPGVSLFAEFGKYLVGSIDTTNLSVHSGFRLPTPKQRPAPPVPDLQEDKVYVSWILSDGDNLPVLTNGNFPQLWQQKERGEFPVGWTMSPSACVLIPDVVDYYFRTATDNDAFLGAVSGVGYTYPDLYGKRYRDPDRQRVYDEFLEQTAEYMQRCDEREVWVMNATQPQIISRFAEKIPFLNALFPDYGRRVSSGEEATYATARNVPVFHATTGWQMEATREERLAQIVADTRRMTPPQRPAFMHLFALNWFTDLPLMQEALKQLGPEYVAVRPDHLAALWRKSMAQEQIVARFPRVGACLEGQPLRLKGILRNMTEAALQVQVSVAAGLQDVTVTPATLQALPAQDLTVVLTGKAVADAVELRLAGDFGTRRVLMPLRVIPRTELVGTLPEGQSLTPATYLEGEALAHRSGESQDDATASEGKAWLAKRGETEPGFIVFGPYAPLPAGKYMALFRMKRLSEGARLLALLDTCVAGGTPQTGLRELRGEELPVGEWKCVPVVFEHPGGNFETRVHWSGAASLAVDSVAVWKLGE